MDQKFNADERFMNFAFDLHACCIAVTGQRRGLIFDNQRKKALLVPNALIEIVEIHSRKSSITDVLKMYDDPDRETVLEYFNFLVLEELIFCASDFSCFPKLSLKWDSPFIITNMIVDLPSNELLKYSERIFLQLEDLGCIHVQFRFSERIDIQFLEAVLNIAEGKSIRSIELNCLYSSTFFESDLIRVMKKFNRLLLVRLFNSPQNEIKGPYEGLPHGEFGTIEYLRRSFINHTNCGNINSSYFSYDLKTFTESHHHNSCLNRKISIDSEGNIKNCPSMAESYGNIRDTTLAEALEKPGFKKYWNITKDQIAVCKDCEFRYICTDCRAYIENPEDIYSKPLKCGYNPYTAEWEEWSTHPMKQLAIKHYGMGELLKKKA
jgi:SPASM domain peptide maturase of grasp-with-spasm system